MLAKIWKKVLLIILIVACLCNLVVKLSKKVSFNAALDAIKTKIQISEIKDD